MKYVCDACEWVYDEEKGYPEGGIAPGTKWEDIPDDFTAFETKAMSYCPKGDSDTDFNLPYAWCGDIMASYTNENKDEINFYTNIEPDENGSVIIGNTELVIVYPDNSFTTQRVFADIFPEFKK